MLEFCKNWKPGILVNCTMDFQKWEDQEDQVKCDPNSSPVLRYILCCWPRFEDLVYIKKKKIVIQTLVCKTLSDADQCIATFENLEQNCTMGWTKLKRTSLSCEFSVPNLSVCVRHGLLSVGDQCLNIQVARFEYLVYHRIARWVELLKHTRLNCESLKCVPNLSVC